MNESLVTFLYELANFVVFATLLGWFFVKPIRRFLDEQAARDDKAAETAKLHLVEAEQLRHELLNERQTFIQEMERQRQAALKEAKQQAEKILENANRNIDHQREQLSREAVQLHQAQKVELARIVARATRQTVANLLTRVDGPDLEIALLQSACQQLENSNPDQDRKITVESATELSEHDQKQIIESASVGSSNGNIQFHVSDELVGGVRIRTSSGLIDHSILGLSEFVEQNLNQQLTHDE